MTWHIGYVYNNEINKICEIAQTKEFFEKPLHPYTQMLLSSIPVVTDEEEQLKP